MRRLVFYTISAFRKFIPAVFMTHCARIQYLCKIYFKHVCQNVFKAFLVILLQYVGSRLSVPCVVLVIIVICAT